VSALRQALVVLVGLLLAAAMTVLGIWQLEVYTSQGADTALARASAPPVALGDVAPPGTAVVEGFGRSVSFRGRFDPSLQVLVPVADRPGESRVLTGLVQADGSIVPVVRGAVDGTAVPSPPTGELDLVGVLLPSEDDDLDASTDPGQMTAIRLPVLAQRWSGPLVGGYVTLPAADAQAQGLAPAPLDLPQAKGRLRNGAYAFQWWVFGAFALGMSIRIARDLGRRDDLEALAEDDERHIADGVRADQAN
jgi:surfeit locus 1 family protein